MKRPTVILLLLLLAADQFAAERKPGQIRLLVVTGGHSYNKETFSEMLNSLKPHVSWQTAELPGAYEMFRPENRDKYDVLLFYHMFQKITPEQQKDFAECIKAGKPLVALHHSICAYDGWEEYWRIIGGKYFHARTMWDGREQQPGSYIHDLKFTANISPGKHPVTRGVGDFELFDETYKGYWVDSSVKPLITTAEPTSTPVIGWTKKYGKARVVVLQPGHDSPTFRNPNYRQLLKQAIMYVAGSHKTTRPASFNINK